MWGEPGLRVAHRQLVVTVQPPQLFDQVDFDRNVETVRGHGDAPARLLRDQPETKPLENPLDLDILQAEPEDLFDPRTSEFDVGRLRQHRLVRRLDHRAGAAADDGQHQLGGPLDRLSRQLWIDAALVAVRSVGVQPVGAGGPGERDRIEVGALQEQGGRAVGNTAVLAPHDAGDGQRALVVGDDQRLLAQRDVLPVEQGQALVLPGEAHPDAAADLLEIEGVHRLAEFEHHVVGDVDDRIDRADAGATQPLDHPARRRAGQIDAADDTPEVARAGLGRQDFHRSRGVDARHDRLDRRLPNGYLIDRPHFAGQPAQREAIAPVRGKADFDADVVEPEVVAHRLATGASLASSMRPL